jgi:death-on-curing protein
MTIYLTTIEVCAMHRGLIEKYGGSHGIRELGALEAALYRPQSGYYSSILQEAAALWESLSQNHPFIDGNKRIAFASMDVFLRLNGYRLIVKPEKAFAFISDSLGKGTFEFKVIEEWLEKNTKSV